MNITQKYKTLVLAFPLLLFFISPAFALDVQKYEDIKKNARDYLEIHVRGVSEGFFLSNAIVKKKYGEYLICPPPDLPLNTEMFIDIIDAQIAKIKATPKVEISKVETPVELLLFYGLVENFPCPK